MTILVLLGTTMTWRVSEKPFLHLMVTNAAPSIYYLVIFDIWLIDPSNWKKWSAPPPPFSNISIASPFLFSLFVYPGTKWNKCKAPAIEKEGKMSDSILFSLWMCVWVGGWTCAPSMKNILGYFERTGKLLPDPPPFHFSIASSVGSRQYKVEPESRDPHGNETTRFRISRLLNHPPILHICLNMRDPKFNAWSLSKHSDSVSLYTTFKWAVFLFALSKKCMLRKHIIRLLPWVHLHCW